MRRGLTLTALAATALAIGAAGVAIASGTSSAAVCLRSALSLGGGCGSPGLTVKVGGGVERKGLPAREVAPAALKLWAKVSTSDGTHPSALREVTIDLDRNLLISAEGLSICNPGGREASIRKACANSIVGGGKADFEIAFPEASPIQSASKLTVYNGGVKGGVTTLYAVASVNVPAPRTIAIPLEFEKIHKGRYGLHAVAKVPVIAGGSGSLLDFRLRIKRSFSYRGQPESLVAARCPASQLKAEISALFRNEAGTPGVPATTAIRGTVALPCS